MDSLFLERIKIPSVLAIVMVIFLMAGIIFATQNLTTVKQLFSNADQGAIPTSVEIANITDSSFAVVWLTDTDSSGAVFYGTSSSLGSVAVDDRDLTSPNGQYKTHFVHLSSLSPSTKYYFKVGTTDPSYGDPNNNNAPFEITTGSQLTAGTPVDPISGTAQTASSSPAAGALVKWKSDGSALLAALTKTDGTYVLPLGTVRTADLSQFFPFSQGEAEKVTIIASATQTATINCTVGKDKPLPPVKIGQTIDCNDSTSTALATPSATPTTSASESAQTDAHFPVPGNTSNLATPSGATAQLNVASGQSFSTPFPTISGKVGPRQMVQITIHSETPYSGTVIANPDGSWSWTPPAGLSAGPHTVTITIVNADGSTQVITRNFTVSSGGPLLPITSGTPSASTTTHLSCVNSACTTVSGAGTDSCTLDSDCTASASATPPVTGSEDFTLMAAGLGAIFLILSVTFLFAL